MRLRRGLLLPSRVFFQPKPAFSVRLSCMRVCNLPSSSNSEVTVNKEGIHKSGKFQPWQVFAIFHEISVSFRKRWTFCAIYFGCAYWSFWAFIQDCFLFSEIMELEFFTTTNFFIIFKMCEIGLAYSCIRIFLKWVLSCCLIWTSFLSNTYTPDSWHYYHICITTNFETASLTLLTKLSKTYLLYLADVFASLNAKCLLNKFFMG